MKSCCWALLLGVVVVVVVVGLAGFHLLPSEKMTQRSQCFFLEPTFVHSVAFEKKRTKPASF